MSTVFKMTDVNCIMLWCSVYFKGEKRHCQELDVATEGEDKRSQDFNNL